MKKYLVIIGIFMLSLLQASSLDRLNFIYEYNNPSLGPIDGFNNAQVSIKNGKVISILDLQSGKSYKDYSKFPEINVILDVLKGKTKGYKVFYNNQGLPKKIISKSIGFSIDITYKKLENSKYLLSKKYETSYKKWKKSDIKSYKYVYQIQVGKNRVNNGVEVTIKNSKVVKAINEFNRRDVDIKDVLTIEDIFQYAKLAIKYKSLKRVYYDKKRGFIRYLEYIGESNKTIRIAVFKFRKVN